MTSDLKLHPACACYDPMPEAELAELARDIKENGLLEPITVMPDGAILDGRNRALACAMAAVPLRTVLFEGNDPVRFVVSKNHRRRHLPPGRRGLIAGKLANLQHGSNRYDKKVEGKIFPSMTRAEAARALDVSQKSVANAKELLRDGAPHVVEMVERGEVGLETAAKAVRNQPQSAQQDWTAADVRREAHRRRTAPTTPTRQPRLNRFALNRPVLRQPTPEECGMPPKEQLGEQMPGEPPGVTRALHHTRTYGHVQLWSLKEAEQIELRGRFLELTGRLIRLAADDLPEPADLARLDPEHAKKVRRVLDKYLAPVQARLAAFAAALILT
jgi:hypothetical protein